MLGMVRRAAKKNDLSSARNFAHELVDLLNPHTAFEEDGLFDALMLDDEYVESLMKLKEEHIQINGLIDHLMQGDLTVIDDLDTLLRNHISNEENGIFPSAAVTIDGSVWDQMEKDYGLVSQTLGARSINN